ncbi:hypothetical protein [Burkholderia ubonensis]|uniref:hypothetical protein n=1 Tax=Burkholderia ubonensis TaxID=101571 RepID=UPI001E62C8B0|nr:hypothetical protein [Burkholderia ubonensis]
MTRIRFATSRAVFATNQIFAPATVAPFSLLSNSLKEKKKECGEEAGIDLNPPPRVRCVLPSITNAAYFLGHEFEGGATGFSWQLMAKKHIQNQYVK